MALNTKHLNKLFNINNNVILFNNIRSIHASKICFQKEEAEDIIKFRPLQLSRSQEERRPKRDMSFLKQEMLPPRETRMAENVDWPSVWPVARSFHPATVPLPLHQGKTKKGAPPYKYANSELMKIPNFLHLTPPAIERHCETLKQFCTPWPAELEDEEACTENFPVEVISSDYVHASPTIRDPRARTVSIRFKLSSLPLDYHARDKIIRLLGPERYYKKTDVATITTDRCPLKQQNYDYSIYCMTALFYESWRVEDWEAEKTEEDYEKYFWERSRSKKTITHLVKKMKENSSENNSDVFLSKIPQNCTADDIVNLQEVKEYNEVVSSLHNDGETLKRLEEYKQKVLQLAFSSDPQSVVEGEIVESS